MIKINPIVTIEKIHAASSISLVKVKTLYYKSLSFISDTSEAAL